MGNRAGCSLRQYSAEYEQMREKELQPVAETVSEMLIQMTHAISMKVASTKSEDKKTGPSCYFVYQLGLEFLLQT